MPSSHTALPAPIEMTPDDLRTMAGAFAEPGANEEFAIEWVRALMLGHATANSLADFNIAYRGGDRRGCVVEFVRTFLPGYGRQTGTMPSGKCYAAVHARGASYLTCAFAATETLALLKAALIKLADKTADEIAARCPDCTGRGWYIAADNTKEMCRHTRVLQAAE